MSTLSARPRLSVRLLGEWRLALDDAPLKGKLYGKVVALLAYLAVQPERNHAREHLAALLWPRLPPESARANLRQALRHLRRALGSSSPAFLEVAGDTLRFHADHPECRVDVAVLCEPFLGCAHGAGPHSPVLCANCSDALESRLAVYQGEFMAGLALNDAPEYEAWLTAKRQSLRERAFLLSERLCGAYEAAGKADLALAHAQRCIELEPWNEAAYRRRMRLLAGQGQYGSAQMHYDSYLVEDLDSDPTAGTRILFETIHDRGLAAGHPRTPALRDSPPGATAQRRQVTVLCCHLDLKARSDADCTEQLADARSVCALVLRRHAGHFTQGHDGYFFAYMGYPAASEEAGRQAALAALELISLFTTPYRFRAGIHTGIMVTGLDPKVPDIIGAVSGAAWRLCRRTRASGIVVSEATARLLKGGFALRALKPSARKTAGEPAQTPAHLLVTHCDAGHGHFTACAPSALIGRRGELKLLNSRWRLAAHGLPQFLVLRGEPGIGKTRLAEALRAELAPTAARVRQLHCYPEHRHTPLYPVIALFESVLGFAASDTPTMQRRKLREYLDQQHPAVAAAAEPVLMLLLSIAPANAPVPSPRQRKQQTLDMMLLLLDSLASSHPLLLIIEDAQWLDLTTLDLLEQLQRRAIPRALMVLITARPDFKPAWLKADATLELQPLPDAEIARLARAVSGALSAEAIDSIVRRADGIPFYAEEMARLCSGAAQGDDGIPATLRDLLLTRLDAVPHARRVLQLAATMGRKFDKKLLLRVGAFNADTLERVLHRLVDAQLISTTDANGQVFQFRHALIQEAAYASQLETDRRDAHHRIARCLSQYPAQWAAQQAAEIAQHYAHAHEPNEAVSWWLDAARQALRLAATAEADGHVREGLALARRMQPGKDRDAREVALLLLQAQSLQLGRGYGSQDAARIYDRASELSHEALSPKQRFEVLWGLWTVSSSRPGYGFQQAGDLARRLLDLAQQGTDKELLAKAHTAQANVALWRNQLEDACRHAQFGAAAGERVRTTIGGLDAAVACLAYQSWACWKQRRIPEAFAASRGSLERARSLDSPDSLCAALGFAAMLARFHGNIANVHEHVCELQAVADLHKLATWQGLAGMLGAWVRVVNGDHEATATLEACAQAIEHVMPSVAALFLHALAEAYGMVGRHEDQLRAIDQGLSAAATVGERYFATMLEDMRRDCLAASPPS